MRDTRNEIVRIADELIRSKGYNAFSYTDISALLQIKNAAIHYYFPSKSDLGVEVIKNTIDSFQKVTASWHNLSYEKQLENWVTAYEGSKDKHWVCIMGALSPAYDTLSDDMKMELERMGNRIIEWLNSLLERGKDAGAFNFPETPKTKAYLIQSSLLASLLLNKVLRNDAYEIIQEGILTR